MQPRRVAFIMEQTLGHVTHSQNLQSALTERSDLLATWLPISFDVVGGARYVPLLRSNWSIRASWRARRALGAALRKAPHEALVFHTQVTSLFSVDLMHRYPTVVCLDATPVNYDSVAAAYGHRAAGGGFVDRRKYELNRRAFQSATTLVAWSDWAKRSLVEDYGVDPSRVAVLAPGAHRAYFEIGEQRLSRSPGQSGSPVRLLFVGGDFARKGGPELIEAVRGLVDACELHVVTNAAIGTNLPNVRVHRGVRPNSPELLSLFRESDLFVLPTHADCLALVLMEATAASLPVITTTVGALPEAVLPGRSGLTLRPGDIAALRAAIEALASDPSLRARMGNAAHVLARGKFDATRNNAALLDLALQSAERRPVHRRVA
jgi:glycosyltransferase involved in cell wall biosynthesis